MKSPPGPYALLPNGPLPPRRLDRPAVPVAPLTAPVGEVPPVVVLPGAEPVVVVVGMVVVGVLIGVDVVVWVGAEVGEMMLVTVWHRPVSGSMRAHDGESEIWAWETPPPLERSRRVVTSAKLAPTER